MPNCEYSYTAYNDYKEVVIIGNGPNGLCTSYMLAGNWPYWNKNKVLDEYLQMRLEAQDNNTSLVQQDLEFLSDGLEGRSRNPVALLFDSLNNPGSDLGYNLDSCIEWKYDPTKEIDHIVIGSTPPGGTWNTFDGDQLTISLSRWMELPDLKFSDFKKEVSNSSTTPEYTTITERATAHDVRDYYQFYVQKKSLEKYMLNRATVKNVRKIVPLFSFYNSKNNNDDNELWEVSGVVENSENEKYQFHFICKHLILCVGATGLYNELKVKGENYNFILHTIHDLEEKVKTQLSYLRKYPLVVVGSGLSAADCILLALKYRIKVIHIIRRSVYDKNIVYPKLPKILYPEYHSIYEKMLNYKQYESNDKTKKQFCDNYTLFDEHRIKSFKQNHSCIIMPNKGEYTKTIFEDDDYYGDTIVGEDEKFIKFSYACLLIGHKINLNFLPSSISNTLAYNKNREIDSKDNPINMNPYTYETAEHKNLYALGPLVGDNFVRFGIGGALAVTNSLWKKKMNKFSEVSFFTVNIRKICDNFISTIFAEFRPFSK